MQVGTRHHQPSQRRGGWGKKIIPLIQTGVAAYYGVKQLRSRVTADQVNERLKPYNHGRDLKPGDCKKLAATETKRSQYGGALAIAAAVTDAVTIATSNSTAAKVATNLHRANFAYGLATQALDVRDEARVLRDQNT
jgi:hypothetical protein